MQFNTIEFILFFFITVAVYFVIPKKLRTIFLLIASYCFYMSWEPGYALLIGFSTLVSYFSALFIEKYRTSKDKPILTICILINLTILVVYKYGNFILDSINTLLNAFRLRSVQSHLDLLLPIGISFYTFQIIGYVIDVYRREIPAEKNLIRYALYVSFFPQLLAGPIARSRDLLPQIRELPNLKLFNAKRVTSGAILMVYGYFIKMVVADRIAIPVNTVFDEYFMYGSTELIFAAVGYTVQVYCDFASYSIIAVGAAKILGIQLSENFRSPYFSKSIKEFWRRWHISLSTWFRDYLYIPLGGNRKGRLKTQCNLMIVFLVSGLWHGADYSFVVWGGLHGLFQIIGNITKPCREKLTAKYQLKTDCFSHRLLQTAVTFLLVAFAWIFFRADSIADALHYIGRIFTRPTPWILFNGGLYELGLNQLEMNILLFSLLILVFFDYVQYKKELSVDVFLMRQNLWFEWTVMILLILMIFVFGQYGPTFDAQQFIYFQF